MIGAYAHNWDNFDLQTAHPANTSIYAKMVSNLFTSPLCLEAYVNDIKVSQWLLFIKRRRVNPFIFDISSECCPQVIGRFKNSLDQLFQKYIEYIKNSFAPRNIIIVNYALVRAVTETALISSGFELIVKFNAYINKISVDDNDIIAQFHTSHRNDTRKAIKMGYFYSPNITPEEYYRLSVETYSRSNREGPSLKYIRNIYKRLVANDKGLISGVYVNGKLNTGSIVFFHGINAYYFFGASSTEKQRGATCYIHYENMRTLRNKGVLFYDFGGARVEDHPDEKARSLSDFKRRFGGKCIETYGGIYR